MSEKDTGGPALPDWPESAFPSTFQSLSPDPHQVHRWGMTLRDYFAVRATEKDIERHSFTGEFMDGYDGCNAIKIPVRCSPEKARYRYADAMLEARKQ